MPDTLTWDDTPLWPQFDALRAAAPDAHALIDCDERVWTRAELGDDAERFAGQLSAASVGRGDRVLVAAHKTAVTAAVALAVSRLKAIFPFTQEEAFGPDLLPLPRGVRGQAGVRGPSLFLGYAQGLGAGQERMTPDGYYLTGDEIVRDTDGFVKVVGRIKDQIIRGGFNIDPAEIEAALLRHPSIVEAAVVPVPERKLGEQACAVCRLLPGRPPVLLAEVLAHMEQLGVSRKKWPEHLLLVEQMAVTATGKMDKKALAALAATTLGRA